MKWFKIQILVLWYYLGVWWRSFMRGTANVFSSIGNYITKEISKDKKEELTIEQKYMMQMGRLTFEHMRRELAVKGLKADGLTPLPKELTEEEKKIALVEAEMIRDDIEAMDHAMHNGVLEEFLWEKNRKKRSIEFREVDGVDSIIHTDLDTGKTTKVEANHEK